MVELCISCIWVLTYILFPILQFDILHLCTPIFWLPNTENWHRLRFDKSALFNLVSQNNETSNLTDIKLKKNDAMSLASFCSAAYSHRSLFHRLLHPRLFIHEKVFKNVLKLWFVNIIKTKNINYLSVYWIEFSNFKNCSPKRSSIWRPSRLVLQEERGVYMEGKWTEKTIR